MRSFFYWLFVTIVLFVFTACGGGGSGTNPQNKPKEEAKLEFKHANETVSINDTYKSIVNTEVDDTNNSFKKLTISNDFAKQITVDSKYIHIPANIDKRFPLGYIGKIEGFSTNSDGTSTYRVEDLAVNDFVEELVIPEETIEFKDMKVIDVITPDNVIPLTDAELATYNNSKRISSRSNEEIKLPKNGKIELAYKIKLDKFVSSAENNKLNIYKETSFIISGSLDNIKIIRNTNQKGGDGQTKIIVDADFDFDIKANLIGSVRFGNFDSFWRDVEKKAIGLGLSIKGLKSLDKVGKIPIAGFVVYPSTAYPMKGKLPTESIKFQPAGMLIWVYFDAKGVLTVNGTLGIKHASHIKFGYIKEKDKKIPTFIGETSKLDGKKFLEAPYFKGGVGFKSDIGVSLDVDMFVAGTRFATASAELKVSYEKDLKSKDEVSLGLEDSFNEPFKWSDGTVCSSGKFGAGVIIHAGFAAGLEYTKKDSGQSSSLGYERNWNYPEAKDIKNTVEGRVGNSLWYVAKNTKSCVNVPSPSTLSNNHIKNYRTPISKDALKNIATDNYLYAYLSARIYHDTSADMYIEKDGWVLDAISENNKNGFKAGLYNNPITNQYIIAYGGTTANSYDSYAGKAYDSLADLVVDFGLLGPISFLQPTDAILFYKLAKSKIGNSGVLQAITGHSLGGGLAQYAGLYSGVKTVTFNTAPLPFNILGSYIDFKDKSSITENPTIMESIKFNHANKITNIMLPFDPISALSTSIMSIDETNVAYMMGVRFMLAIPPIQKLDYLITGEQIYLPYNKVEKLSMANHGSALFVSLFKANTTHSLNYTLVQNGSYVVVENIDTSDIDVTKYRWEAYQNGNLIKQGEGVETIDGLSSGTYTIKVFALLPNGLWIDKESEIELTEVIDSGLKLELLNPDICRSTGYCQIKAGVPNDKKAFKATLLFGDGASAGMSGGDVGFENPDAQEAELYSYSSFAHTYNIDGTYNITFSGSIDGVDLESRSLEIVVKKDAQVSNFKLKKTGQTKSYDQYGNEVTDGSIKDDGYYQTGVTPSYTRDATKEVVIDHVTGLMWQDNEEAKTIKKPWITQANYDVGNYNDTSGDTATTYCSNLVLGGYSDWRLPTRKELLNIKDFSRGFYSANIIFSNINFDNSYYISSTIHIGFKGSVWADDFDGMETTPALGGAVRCIRTNK